VTFLFTDVVGSTELWDDAPLAMASAMRDHDEVIEHSITSNDGAVVRPLGEGDSRFGVFRDAECALRAAVAISVRLVSTDWPTPRPITVRMALHTDEGDVRAGDYHGSAVNRCARLRSIAAPGEILLTQAVIDGVEPTMLTDFGLIELGETRLKDVATPQHLYVVRPSPLDRTAR
jgi:class 3 adenylate cyclase